MALGTITRETVTIYTYEDKGIYVVEARRAGDILTAQNTTDVVGAYDAMMGLAERHPDHILKAGVRP